MEDDDIADTAQKLLDAIGNLLRNDKLIRELSRDDFNVIRNRRAGLEWSLKSYRDALGYTERRQIGPNRLSTPQVQLSAVLAIAAPIGVRSALGIGVTAVAGGEAAGEGTGLVFG